MTFDYELCMKRDGRKAMYERTKVEVLSPGFYHCGEWLYVVESPSCSVFIVRATDLRNLTPPKPKPMMHKGPSYKIELDATTGNDNPGLTILDSEGNVVHVSTTWELTASHLAFALQEIDRLKSAYTSNCRCSGTGYAGMLLDLSQSISSVTFNHDAQQSDAVELNWREVLKKSAEELASVTAERDRLAG